MAWEENRVDSTSVSRSAEMMKCFAIPSYPSEYCSGVQAEFWSLPQDLQSLNRYTANVVPTLSTGSSSSVHSAYNSLNDTFLYSSYKRSLTI